ncbi:hypothetical protein TGAM01_v204070 [Trichoderma gamsii]|uniref:Uncharacterized protein n=1 Tax=Trichoderma gamsii TaxID=398673 RepID=A0A2P4ZS73_9HYPO|nr:hypothetical protein TGAM01_v204070 [Trichoderma gamsii]PON27121.1 hypothetical protein TGAM01_v204070 [Trichoderma gamsii]
MNATNGVLSVHEDMQVRSAGRKLTPYCVKGSWAGQSFTPGNAPFMSRAISGSRPLLQALQPITAPPLATGRRLLPWSPEPEFCRPRRQNLGLRNIGPSAHQLFRSISGRPALALTLCLASSIFAPRPLLNVARPVRLSRRCATPAICSFVSSLSPLAASDGDASHFLGFSLSTRDGLSAIDTTLCAISASSLGLTASQPNRDDFFPGSSTSGILYHTVSTLPTAHKDAGAHAQARAKSE